MSILLPYQTEALDALIKELDEARLRLDYKGPLPRTWGGRLRRELEAEAVAASTRMEGVPVTVEEVRRILAGDPPPAVREEDRALVEGYREAMSFVLRRADDPAFTWNREIVVALHDRVLGGRYSLGAGRLRTDAPVFIVNSATGDEVFLPPEGDLVPDLVDEACDRMSQGHRHPGIAAAWIHVAIAGIHPFRDGNGRSARVLASLAMYRGGFQRIEFTSLEEWWGRHLKDYYAAFDCLGARFDRNADVTPFIRAHLEAQLHQVRTFDYRERVERQVWTALEETAERSSLSQRTVNALWDAFFGREVTAGYYRSLADVSPATATTDLAAATSAGLLESIGERRGRRYRARVRLYESVASVLNIDQLGGSTESACSRIVGVVGRRLVEAGAALGLDDLDAS
jgi:Fic family protein